MENHNGSIFAEMQKELLKINHVPCKSTYIRYGKDPHSMAIFQGQFPCKNFPKFRRGAFPSRIHETYESCAKEKEPKLVLQNFVCSFRVWVSEPNAGKEVSKFRSVCQTRIARSLYLTFNKSTGQCTFHEYLDHFSSLLFLNE